MEERERTNRSRRVPVSGLRERGVRAAYVTSSQHPSEQHEVFELALAGELEAAEVSRSGISLRAVRTRLMPVCFVRFWRLRLIWRRTCIAASRGLCA